MAILPQKNIMLQGLAQWIKQLLWPQQPDNQAYDAAIIGIGNPGAQYAATRHNVGFDVVDKLAEMLRCPQKKIACQADISAGRLESGKCIACAKPQTFVNRSGVSAKLMLKYLRISPAQCLVVVDDFNLELGRLRFRRSGSDGGHNGLKSVIAEIGSDFPRLRVGIGPVAEGLSTIDFVLGRFGPDQIENKNSAVIKAAQGVVCFCESGIDTAMSRFNT